MNVKRLVALVTCVAALTAGCSNEQDDIVETELELFDELNDVLESITDGASVEMAIPKLEALNERFKELAARPERQRRLTGEERERGITKHGEALLERSRIAGGHIRRIFETEAISKKRCRPGRGCDEGHRPGRVSGLGGLTSPRPARPCR